MTKYLVTGAAGFIGSHLVENLIKRGDKVRGVDNFATGRLENIKSFLDDFEFVEGDLREDKVVSETVKDVDVIFHEAAIPSVPRSVADPWLSHESNVDVTLKLLMASRGTVKRLIYAASSSAYGQNPRLPKIESFPIAPISPYAVTKVVGELYCKVFTEIFEVETISLRYFNVFGPRQNPKSQYAAVIPKFIVSMLRGEQPRIYGDGLQSRDFTYVQNVVEANLLAAKAKKASGQVYNIACGQQIDLLTLVTKINQLLETEIEPILDPERAGDVKHSLAAIDNARRGLKFEPVVSFDEGLAKTVDWFKCCPE